MQLIELIPNATLVLHKNDVLVSKTGTQAEKLGFGETHSTEYAHRREMALQSAMH